MSYAILCHASLSQHTRLMSFRCYQMRFALSQPICYLKNQQRKKTYYELCHVTSVTLCQHTPNVFQMISRILRYFSQYIDQPRKKTYYELCHVTSRLVMSTHTPNVFQMISRILRYFSQCIDQPRKKIL